MDQINQNIARALLGSGMAGQAADKKQMYPIWQQQSIQAQIDGQEFPQFEEWFQQQMQQNRPQPMQAGG